MELDRQLCVATRTLFTILEGPLPTVIENNHAQRYENFERGRLWELLGGKLQTNCRTLISMNGSKCGVESVVLFPVLQAWRDQSRLPVKIAVPEIRLRVLFHMHDHMPEWSIYKIFVFASDGVTNELVGDPRPEFEICIEPK